MQDASTCSYPECGRPIEAKGYCQTHNRQRRQGKLLTPLRNYDRGLTSIERFMKRVMIDPATGCWNWRDPLPEGEYPRFADGGQRTYAHRWIWEHTHGAIPKGMDIDHTYHCYCVNPAHLRLCTHGQNGQNLVVSKANSSGYRGVSLHRASGLWFASVKFQGRRHSFGYHRTAAKAGKAAAEGRRKLFTHSMI